MQTFGNLDELTQRGRVFYEMFPGTAASDVWREAFDAVHTGRPDSDTPDGGDRRDDRNLDETVDETFPASDAPANTVETGIRVGRMT